MPPEKISHEQIRDAVHRSGYLLEYRVEQVLGRRGYMVEPNQAYPDPITGKSRELDISAIKAAPITADFRNTLWPRLLIECVNNPQPIAFFTKAPIAPTAHIYSLKFSGLPVKVRKEKRWTKLSDFLNMQDYHHHCRGRIATQFCSFTAKRGSANSTPKNWLAQHEDGHFDSFNKLCFALNHDIDEHYSRSQLRGKETINVQLYYPILVVAGELIDIMPTRKEIKLRRTNHVHYVQSYISKGQEQSYHIDVVTEKYLPRLLTLIDKETKETVRLLKRDRKPIQASIDEITASVKGVRSIEVIRTRMEYRGPWGTV